MKFSVTLLALASAAYFCSPVIAQDGTPEKCKAPCESIQKIEACNDADLACVCADQLLKDSQECRKCVIDSGVTASLVPGFNEVLTAHAEVCKATLQALDALTSTSTTSTGTSDPSASSTSSARTGSNRNDASVLAFGVKHFVGLGAGLAALALASLL